MGKGDLKVVKQKQKIGLVFVFLLMISLFSSPFLSIPRGLTGALPNLMIYFLVIWIILILTMAKIFSKRFPED